MLKFPQRAKEKKPESLPWTEQQRAGGLGNKILYSGDTNWLLGVGVGRERDGLGGAGGKVCQWASIPLRPTSLDNFQDPCPREADDALNSHKVWV